MLEALTSLIVATTLLLGSPGPVPIALAATGAVFGFRRGIPFLIGILTGLSVAITLGSAGIIGLFTAYPDSRNFVGICGAVYICYVAFKIAIGPPLSSSDALDSVPSFRNGFILNLLNPKAYAAFIALFSQFLLPLSTNFLSTAATAFVAFLIAVAVDVAWLLIGGTLRPVFESPRYARIVRISFGLLMVGATLFAFRDL